MKNNQYKKHSNGKLKVGPGGMCCPCCTKYLPNMQKKKINRTVRREVKVELKKEVPNA